MRAVEPAETGVARSADGVRLAYEVFGAGDPTLVLLPSTPIVHSRQWKGQVAYLARQWRVITYDGRGNGLSDRPVEPAAYAADRLVDDLEAVLDATGTRAAVLVGLCGDGVWPAVRYAAARPDRVLGIVAFAIGVPLLSPPHPWRVPSAFDDVLPTYDGWAKVNADYWRRDYRGFAEFFFGAITTEPHSSKAIEDAVDWATDGSVEAMLADAHAPSTLTKDQVDDTLGRLRCEVLAVHGTEDACQPVERARRFAACTGAQLVIVEGANHMIPGRHPVLANLLIRDFVRSLPAETVS